ncbi:MAG: transrane protein [Xanthobacteraceae bacterium]|jgi:hypothetical protein|nr:transrane protein [Xanthobacteraceae bacterium]
MNFLVGFPLLIVPFAIYNMIVFLLPGLSLTDPLFSVHMLSGADMSFSISDLLLVFSILLLFVEVMKSTRVGTRSIIDHMLSLLLFIVMMAEFIITAKAATSTFLILTVLCLVDVIAGFSITIRAAQRDVSVDHLRESQS